MAPNASPWTTSKLTPCFQERFWAWDYERWRADRCTRSPDGQWVQGWLQNTYEDVQKRNPHVVAEITRQQMEANWIEQRCSDYGIKNVIVM